MEGNIPIMKWPANPNETPHAATHHRHVQSACTALALVGLLAVVLTPSPSFAQSAPFIPQVNPLLLETEELLEAFQFLPALTLLDEAVDRHPSSPRLHKKRGDVLMILGRNQEALAAYRRALALAPRFLEGHWALWALLDRLSSHPEEAFHTLMQIVEIDNHNPLAQLQVGRHLRKMRRFQDAVPYFRRAVELAPMHLGYHLFLARALYDSLQYQEARQEVEWVLAHAKAGSPEWAAARNLSHIVKGETTDKGALSDFFATTKRNYGDKGKDYKSWALSRGRALKLMNAGNYAEAEIQWRKVLTFDPKDELAYYQLGVTLMALERFEEAITALQASFQQSKHPPHYAEAVFKIGQCFSKLGRWDQAIPYFRRILAIQEWKDQDFYALNFPELRKVQSALDEALTHVPDASSLPPLEEPAAPEEPAVPPDSFGETDALGGAPIDNMALTFPEDPSNPLRILPLSVDVVRGWFRQLILARGVTRDNRPSGFHDYFPLDPGDTFLPSQPRIYLVFALTTPPADARQITTQWVLEQSAQEAPGTIVGTDAVIVDVHDSTGYFYLDQPEGGWPVGTYRIDLLIGEDLSTATHVTDVRFRIVSEED